MSPHRTFYLVPANVVAQPTVAVPRPLAPSPRIISAVPVATKATACSVLKRPMSTDPVEALLGEPQQIHQRKRECLDHLTHEQKMNRRKMKNRIAAQTARDRKKYRSQRLEDVVRELLERNEELKQENELLRAENNDLTEQNRILMARLMNGSERVTYGAVTSKSDAYKSPAREVMREKSGSALESAAFINGLLPRVQVVPLYLLLHLITSLMLVVCSSQTNSKRSSATSQKRTSNSISTSSLSNYRMKRSPTCKSQQQAVSCSSQIALLPGVCQWMRVS